MILLVILLIYFKINKKKKNKDEKSFINLQRWIDDVKEERGDEVLIYILANKIDLEESR